MEAARRHLRRLITKLAVFAVLLAALLPPIAYFMLTSRYQQGVLTAIAELSAEHISALVVVSPDTWKYQQIRLENLLEPRPSTGNANLRRITDINGEIIAENGEHPQWPTIKGLFLIHDSGVPVAQIEIIQTLRPVLVKALLIAICSAGLALLVFYVAWVLPTRAVAAVQYLLAESERKYRSLFLAINEAVLLLEFGQDLDDASVVEVNPACRLLFYSNFPNMVGLSSIQLFGDINQEMTEVFHQVLQHEQTVSQEKELPDLEKMLSISVAPAGKGRLAVMFSDVTDYRAAERQVQQLVSFDVLTGLPNRVLLSDRLKQAMLACDRDHCKVAVFCVGLDHFKSVNDSLGHTVGDLLLQAVAERLESGIRKTDTISRIGGDEFIIVITDLHNELNASLVASEILGCLDEPFWIADRELFINGSIGISVFPDDAEDANTLLKNADMAMYAAKGHGRNRYHYYAPQLQERAAERLEVETALRHALVDNLLSLAYQPQFDARNGKVIGLEALLRWNNQVGIPCLSPLQIITIAEENGMIIPIGEWVLHTACGQLRQWQKDGLTTPRLAINLSAVQFQQPCLVQIVQDVLRLNDLAPDCIELELTESSIMQRPDEAKKKLQELKQLGVWLALDDFGTGYSSLSYLKLFPIDRLKIDRSFVNEAPANHDDAAIVETIISLAHNMQMKVIAEGVESQEHVEFLVARGCHEMQGYYYARPMPADQCANLLIPGFITEKCHAALPVPT